MILDQDHAAVDGLAMLQRTVGNRAVAELLARRAAVLQRQATSGTNSGAAKATTPSPSHQPSLDEIAKQIGSGLGGPYKTWAEWEKTMKAGTFLGHDIGGGVRPEFQKHLDTAKTKVDDEYKKSGNPIPAGYGIQNVGGYRKGPHPHGAGVAIDIDVRTNPYVMHEGAGDAKYARQGHLTPVDQEQVPVYGRIAEFMLNDPIDGEQSIVPELIRSGGPIPKGTKATRRERLGQYWDRFKLESDAMVDYFRLMRDKPALEAHLKGDWVKTHPKATPPDADATIKQMWADFAVLGGAIPKGGVPEAPGVTDKGVRNPFHTKSGQQDPGGGFISIPKEVVVGLGQAVERWGAIDFGLESGDVQHFDDKGVLGGPFYDAMAAAKAAIIEADQKAKEEADKAKAGSGSGGTGTTGAGTSAAPAVQRRVEPSSDTDVPAGPEEPAPVPLTRAQRLSGAHWKQIADTSWGGATPDIAELESGFGKDVQAFIDMLAANGITASLESGFRPPQRSYLFHWCTLLAKGKVKAADVPSMDGVDILWDHGNEAASRQGAQELAKAFGLVGVAAHPSNHNSGTAVDLKFDFSGNTSHSITYTLGAKTVTRKIKVSGEPTVGSSAAGRSISNIGSRELSRAGADFGLHRAIDNDIVHWSRTGR